MARIDFIGNFLRAFGGNEYYKTPKLGSYQMTTTGQPEFLNPDSWNEFDVYMTTPQLYAVVQRLGYLLSSGQWKHYKVGKDGKPELIMNSPYVNLLENPNPLMKGNDLIRQWNENRCLYGNNYEYMLKAFSSAMPSALSNIPPTEMAIKTSGKIYKQSKIEDIIQYYELVNNGNQVDKFEPSEINHTRIVNALDPIKGVSPMKALYMPISNIRSAYQFRNVIMTKRGALGILSNQAKNDAGAIPLTKKERERIESQYQQDYGIGNDQNKMILTDASLNYQAMGYPTKDLMLFEEVDTNFLTIIDAYGLNANLFSREKGSTFENMAEGVKQAYQSTVIPMAEELAMNRTEKLNLPNNEWLELDFNHITVLQENEKERAEVRKIKADALITLIESGLYSSDEIRGIINFD